MPNTTYDPADMAARGRTGAHALHARYGPGALSMPAEYAEHVRRIVDAAPPLTEEQIDRLAAIVRAGQVAAETRRS